MPAIIRKAANKFKTILLDRKARKMRQELREERKRMVDFAYG